MESDTTDSPLFNIRYRWTIHVNKDRHSEMGLVPEHWFFCFFGLGYPVGLFHLFDRRPQIIINENGIFDRTTYKDFINWDVIQDAYPLDIHRQKFVCLVVDKRFEPSTKKGKFVKSISKLSKHFGGQELNISLGQVKIDEIKLTEFILTMIKLRPENRKEMLKDRLLM